MSSILILNSSVYTIFPIQYQSLWNMYKTSLDLLWRPEEIHLAQDVSDWNKLNSNEQHFISFILAFFAASDGLVMENLATRFFGEVQISEARSFYAIQIAMENIHSETYSILIDTLIQNNEKKMKLFHAIETVPCIQKKAEWVKTWLATDADFATRLVAFACVEGIFFSGAFCSIFWLKQRGIMPGLTFSNELISRDEALHCEFAVELLKYLEKPKADTVNKIVQEAVAIEHEFICEALPCRLIGINADLMKQYIEFVANRLLQQLGYDKLYNATNPFPWMETISLQNKSNFFEKTVSEYSLANTEGKETVFTEILSETF